MRARFRDVHRRLLLSCTSAVLFMSICCSNSWAESGSKLDWSPTPFLNGGQKNQVIRVGVRKSAEPFSYLKLSSQQRSGRDSTKDRVGRPMSDYDGYMVRICDEVLRMMTVEGVFKGYSVEAVEVTAEDRFQRLGKPEEIRAHYKKETSGQASAETSSSSVDILCGPDSVTGSRLAEFSVSLPVFISGMGYATVRANELPPGEKKASTGVIGVVKGSVAESEGLTWFVRGKHGGRFTDAVVKDLTKRTADERNCSFSEQNESGAQADPTGKTNGIDKNQRKRAICYAEDHQDLVTKFCQKNLLYYMADVDILRTKIVRAGADCRKRVIVRPMTFSTEVYAFYFRKQFGGVCDPLVKQAVYSNPETTDEKTDPAKRDRDLACVRDAMLFEAFSNVLREVIRSQSGPLATAYRAEFGEREMSPDLKRFLEGVRASVGRRYALGQ